MAGAARLMQSNGRGDLWGWMLGLLSAGVSGAMLVEALVLVSAVALDFVWVQV